MSSFSSVNLQSSGDPLEEHEDESFVLMAVFHAVEDGNLKGIKELVDNLTTFDPNQKNKVSHLAVQSVNHGCFPWFDTIYCFGHYSTI